MSDPKPSSDSSTPSKRGSWLLVTVVALALVAIGAYAVAPYFEKPSETPDENAQPYPAPSHPNEPVAEEPHSADSAQKPPSATPSAPDTAKAGANETSPTATANMPAATASPALPPSAAPQPPSNPAQASPQDSSGSAPTAPAPSFDIVRVDPQGMAVMAGRAPPDAELVIQDHGEELAHFKADPDGQWVFTPETPLAPGSHALSLLAKLPNGNQLASTGQVLVSVPSQNTAAAKQGKEAPLVVLATKPSSSEPGLKVLQTPDSAKPAASSGAKNVENAALSLHLVEYDQEGDVRFGGQAPPGAPVRVYVDNQPVGDALADSKGQWILKPNEPIAPGKHAVRVDELKPDGKVVARMELPFQREQIVPPHQLKPGQVVVQPGESLWKLAYRAYGSGARYGVIYRANRKYIRDPNRIYPGQVLTVPPLSATRAKALSKAH